MYSGALHPYNLNLFSMAGIIVSLLDDKSFTLFSKSITSASYPIEFR